MCRNWKRPPQHRGEPVKHERSAAARLNEGAMRLAKRIRVLEGRLVGDPVILHFADGSTRELHGPRDLLLRLFIAACQGGNLSAERAEQLELIRQCVYAQEPGNGRMVEAVKVMLSIPAEQRESWDSLGAQ